jgi:DNA polymerase-3 subunit gamma/tau
MKWICVQERIEADDETLGVLAQAGEGSVRDSLSALDQAIACCGAKLDAAEVRRLLGMFSLESLHEVTSALAASDSRRMLEIVAELERNGRHLQHFCRELARYFRNLLVVKITGAGTRLVPASPEVQQRMASIAAGFSEDDLTRYLQLTLDLFGDMQQSLQPRLHLELGLLRLVHAGRLTSIEEALASLQSAGAPAPPRPNPPAPPPQAQPAASPARPTGDLRGQLRAHLAEAGMTFTADGIDHSDVTENGGEIAILAPEEFRLAMKESDLQKAAQAVLGKPVRVKVSFGKPAAAPETTKAVAADDEAAGRAMANPEVRRFQELFPGSQVRVVRNLKE